MSLIFGLLGVPKVATLQLKHEPEIRLFDAFSPTTVARRRQGKLH